MSDRNQRDNAARNNVDGTTDDLKGRAKDAVGGLTGDSSMQAEGKWDQMKGKAKDALGDAQRKMDDATRSGSNRR